MEKKVILVAEDDLTVCRLYKFLLGREGYTVKEAHTGREFLLALGLEKPLKDEAEPIAPVIPDIILLDVCLPEVDGYTLAMRLQQSESLSRIPLIIVTAKERMAGVFSEMQNVKGFFPKPFDPKALKEKIKSLIG